VVPAQTYVAREAESFRQFPPRQKPASFNLDRVMENLQNAAGEALH
jgi:arylsulfatase